jgi:hypothetical protein
MATFANVIRYSDWTTAFQLGITKVYKDVLRKQPKMYGKWLREEKAEHFIDKEWTVSGLGVMPEKVIGSTISTDQIFQGVTKSYTMKTYALALVIQYEVFRWDLFGIFPDVVEMIAKAATDRYNLVAYGLWNNAFTADAALIYATFQGEAICSTTHTRLDGGTWSNRPSTDVGLSYTALQQAVIDLRKQVDERGRFVQVSPRAVIVAVENDWIAKTIVRSDWMPENANRQINLTREQGLSEVHSAPFITQPNYYFVVCEKEDYKIKMSLGDGPDLVKDSDVRTRNQVYTSYASFRFDSFNSVGIWGSTG